MPTHAVETLKEIQAELRQAEQSAQMQATGVVRAAIRELGLTGTWRVDGDFFVKGD